MPAEMWEMDEGPGNRQFKFRYFRLLREGVKINNYFFSSLLLLRGPATPLPLSSPVDNLDLRSIF